MVAVDRSGPNRAQAAVAGKTGRRSLTLLLTALLIASSLVAASGGVTEAAESASQPDVEDTWRGWVATELEDGAYGQKAVWRAYWEDSDRESGNGEYHSDLFISRASDVGSDCPRYYEAAGTATSETFIRVDARTYEPGDPQVPAGGSVTAFAAYGGGPYISSTNVWSQLCGNAPTTGPGTLNPGWPPPTPVYVPIRDWAGGEPAPATVAATYEWTDSFPHPDAKHSATVCMSRSTIDSDGDGFPDEVDLAPLQAGAGLNLGHPAGEASWNVKEPARYGGPDGVRGLPQCPAETQPAPDPDCRTAIRDGSAGVEVRRHYTRVDGSAAANLAGMPDPDVGSYQLGVKWCVGPDGAHVLGTPNTYAIPSTKWALLGALESQGFELVVKNKKPTVNEPGASAPVPRRASVTSRAYFDLKFSPVAVLVSFTPWGKLSKGLRAASKVFRRDLKRGVPKRAARKALYASISRTTVKFLDGLESRLTKSFDKIPGVSHKRAKKVSENVTDDVTVAVLKVERQVAKRKELVTKKSLSKILNKVTSKVSWHLWSIDLTLVLHPNHQAYLSNKSHAAKLPVRIEDVWKDKTL